MFPYNFHTHSKYCDGKGEIDDYAQAAIELGFKAYGASSHAPIPYPNNYATRLEQLGDYIADVKRAKQIYADQIEIAMGMEVDIIPGIQDHFLRHVVPQNFDYFIGSVHFVGTRIEDGLPWEFDGKEDNFIHGLTHYFDHDIRRMALEFYERERMVPDFIPGIAIAGHMDRIKRFNYNNRFFEEQESWYRDAVEETLQTFAAANIVVELNTAGWRTPTADAYPSDWIVRRCHELNIRMTINTDAHVANLLVADHERGLARLRDAGYRELWVWHAGEWVPVNLP
jgi:histidinol-phosphatase (PHP family)